MKPMQAKPIMTVEGIRIGAAKESIFGSLSTDNMHFDYSSEATINGVVLKAPSCQ